MKRILLILSLSLLCVSLFAYALPTPSGSTGYDGRTVKPITLQAGYGTVIDFSVEPIIAGSQSMVIGMPFNLDDGYIQYQGPTGTTEADSVFGSGSGRTIAEWAMLFNTPVKIRITADPLKHVDETGDNSLTYFLAFECQLSFYTSETGAYDSIIAYIIYDGNHKTTYIWDYEQKTTYPNFGAPYPSDNFASFKDLMEAHGSVSSYVGNAQGTVIFGFTEESTEKLKAADTLTNFPGGWYHANVTVEVEALE